jgi:hemerythrin-like metal-binding protein
MATATPPTNLIFPWSDAYSVRIPQIDAQHKGLIRLINDLHSAMAAGKGKEASGTILDELIRYTESHFKYEEGMLRQRQYSNLAAHQTEHKKLTGQVVELRERFRSARLTMSVEVMQFLKNWLANHILVHDQAYARELNAAATR